MSEQNVQAYAVLARAYEDAGFANYVLSMTPRIVTFLQQDDWMGRRILDVGCGTGASSVFLADKGFNVIALDYSREMMDIARLRIEGTGHLIDFVYGDLRTTDFPRAMDLVFAMGNVVNELMSMSELELFFRKSFDALDESALSDLGWREDLHDNRRRRLALLERFGWQSALAKKLCKRFSQPAPDMGIL